VKKAAEEAFDKATFDKTHVKALATALALNKTPRMRARLVDALAKLGPDAADAADDIGRVARDSDGELRRKAVMTLAAMGPAGKKAAPMLLDVMNAPNEKAARRAVEAAMALTKMDGPESKQALPLLVKGILVTDPSDEKQRGRQDRVCKVLIALGTPAAEAMSKTLGADFFYKDITSEEGKQKAAARKKVMETLLGMGKKANTSQVLRDLAETQKRDPDLDLRKLAEQIRVKIQM